MANEVPLSSNFSFPFWIGYQIPAAMILAQKYTIIYSAQEGGGGEDNSTKYKWESHNFS